MRGLGSLATAITSLKLTKLQTESPEIVVVADYENYLFKEWLGFSPASSKTATKTFDD